MNIVVLVKLVPDLVEELVIDESGAALDQTWMRLVINEFDDHAIEQAILIKERWGGLVTVVTPDMEGAEDVLFTAAAKGADSLVKLSGDFEKVNNHALARVFSASLPSLQPDLILTGVQAHNDLDGSLGPLVAGFLSMPYIGYISCASVENGKVSVHKEYPGGLIGEIEVACPAVLGIQAAEQPPRYVAVSKVRQAMKMASIDEISIDDLDLSCAPEIDQLFQPEVGERAKMIEGSIDEVADQLVLIFKEIGAL
jgi:electron transfer flavoprotein beta subunit